MLLVRWWSSEMSGYTLWCTMTSILAGCCWTVVVIEDLRVFPVLSGLVLLYDTKRLLASLVWCMYALRKTLRPSWSAFLVLESEHAANCDYFNSQCNTDCDYFSGEKDLIHYEDSLEVQIISSTTLWRFTWSTNHLKHLPLLERAVDAPSIPGLACPLRASAQCEL